MPQRRTGHRSLRDLHRHLSCEPLERRALLTALVAQTDIGPLPLKEFTVEARNFVASTLEQVKLTQHQTPVDTSFNSRQAIAADGSLLRITQYTVETAEIGGSPLQTNSARTQVNSASAATHSADALRGNLVFSFTVYPDASVSIRARWNAPLVWTGFAASQSLGTNYSLLKSVSLRDQSLFGGHESESQTLSTAQRSIATGLDSQDFNSSPQRAEAKEGQAHLSERLGILANDAAEYHDDFATVKRSELLEAEGLAAWQPEVGGFRAVLLDWLPQVEKSPKATAAEGPNASGSVTDAKAEKFGAEVDEEARAALAQIPILPGMVQLELVLAEGTQAGAVQSGSQAAAAIYQVFMQPSAELLSSAELAIATESPLVAGHGGELEATPATLVNAARDDDSRSSDLQGTDPAAPSPWSARMLALVSLACGTIWSLKTKRTEQTEAKLAGPVT